MGTSFSDRLSRQSHLLCQPNPDFLLDPVVASAHSQLDRAWEVRVEIRAFCVERVVNGCGALMRQFLDRLAIDQRAFENR